MSILILMGMERKWDLVISLCCCSCSCTFRHTSLAVALTLPILVKRAAILSLRRNPAARRFSRWLKQASMEPAGARNIEGGVSMEKYAERSLKTYEYPISFLLLTHTVSISFCPRNVAWCRLVIFVVVTEHLLFPMALFLKLFCNSILHKDLDQFLK